MEADKSLSINEPKKAPPVSVYLTSDTEHCRFWVSFYRAGSLKTSDFIANLDTKERLRKSVEPGLLEVEPVMLSYEHEGEVRYEVLYPYNSEDSLEKMARGLSDTIMGCTPSSLGFYLSPELFDSQSASGLLVDVVSRVVSAGFGDIYLYIGDFGLNRAVNMAVEVRNKVKDYDLIIFH